MSGWSCDQIKSASDGRWVIEPQEESIQYKGVAIDSRVLKPGQIFFAFVGEHSDGHQYLNQVREAGASMCVVTDPSRVPKGFGIPVLVVDDMLKAITGLAKQWRSGLEAQVIAITGSNGKTTTCRFVHALCAQVGRSSASVKSFNNALGVPITILNTPIDAQYLVAELGTSSPGEIKARALLVEPDVVMITSIGSAHLEELGGRAGVIREKSSIVGALRDGGVAVVIGGLDDLDEAIEQCVGQTGCSVRIERVDPGQDIQDVISTDQGVSFGFGDRRYQINAIGRHNALNATMAIVVARKFGINDRQIDDGLKDAKLPEMRLERIEIETEASPIVIYNDAYNANPDSVLAALETFDELKGASSPKIAVIGDMLELGSHTQAQHRRIVERLAQYHSVDRYFLVGPAFALVGSEDDCATVFAADTAGLERLAGQIVPGSCVLLKGSRGIRLERVVELLRQQYQHSSD